MPLIQSSYQPGWLYHRHLSTIYMGRIRPVAYPKYSRERIEYFETDFLDLDWIKQGSSKLVIIVHGLEGSSQSQSVRALATCLSRANFDVLALNLCGCSGVFNARAASYNSGSSDQLECAIEHVLKTPSYETLSLVGISVGGNITLKYLGEKGRSFPSKINAAVAVSVPCDLAGSSNALSQPHNFLYLRDILGSLKAKMKEKALTFPSQVDARNISRIRNFEEFDSTYTAPLNGYVSSSEYYAKASSLPVLAQICCKTLLLSALDDSFLSPSCFPFEIARASESLYLETPSQGGHVAFPLRGGGFWLGTRVLEFLRGQD